MKRQVSPFFKILNTLADISDVLFVWGMGLVSVMALLGLVDTNFINFSILAALTHLCSKS